MWDKEKQSTVEGSVAQWFGWVVCGLGALFYCYEYLLRITPSVMSAELMHAFRLNATAFGNLVAFYYYAYTPMQLLVGVLMDHYSPRKLLIFACAVCALGTYLFGSEFSIRMAYLGRFLVGLGSAFAFVGVLKLATLWLPPHRFAFISGLTTTLGMLGAMIGDILLSSLIRQEGWKHTIIFSAVIGVILTVIIGIVMPDNKKNSLAEIPTSTFFKDFKLLLDALHRIIKNPYIWLNGLTGCLLYLSLSGFGELWGVPYLGVAYHGANAAYLNSFIFFGWAMGGPLVGFFSDSIRRRCFPIMLGALGTTVLFTIIIYVPGISESMLKKLLFLVGVFSSSQVLVFPIARELSSAKLAATALAMTNMLVMMGGMIFQPMIGKLLDIKWSGQIVNHVHVYTLSDYKFALAILPISALLAVIITLFIKETYAKVVDS